MKLSDMNPNEHLKVLVYGNSGAGKTCFAAGCPGPIWFADFDGKVSSAASFYANDKAKLSQIEVSEFTPDPKKDPSYVRFYTELVGLLRDSNQKGFKTIVVDSMTTYADAMMTEIIRQNPGIKRWDKSNSIPVLQDYAIFSRQLKDQVAKLLSFNGNVIVTAHIKIDKDESTGEVTRQPLLPGQSAATLPILFPEMYRAWVDGAGKHTLQTRPDSKYACRTQITKLPASIPSNYNELTKYF